MELTVKKAFIDKNDESKTYKVGETLHTDELDRVNNLVSRGLCVITSVGKGLGTSGSGSAKVSFQEKEYDLNVVKDALSAINAPVAKNAGVSAVNKAIEALSEDGVIALKEALSKQ